MIYGSYTTTSNDFLEFFKVRVEKYSYPLFLEAFSKSNEKHPEIKFMNTIRTKPVKQLRTLVIQ